jgi:hypothetical protein
MGTKNMSSTAAVPLTRRHLRFSVFIHLLAMT